MVVKDVFDIYGTMKGVQNVFGDEQQAWIDEKLTSSSAWRLFASPVSLAPMVVDLSGFDTLPDEVRTMFYINVDQFDGFILKRKEMLDKLRANRSVILSGDIHSTFVTDHHGVAEFTGSSVSSATFSETLEGKLRKSDLVTGIEGLVEVIESLDLDAFLIACNQALVAAEGEFSVLKEVDTLHHGYMTVDVEQDSIAVSAYLIDPVYVSQKLYNSPGLNKYFIEKSFTVTSDGRLV